MSFTVFNIKEFVSEKQSTKEALDEIRKQNQQQFNDEIYNSILFAFENDILNIIVFRINFISLGKKEIIRIHRDDWDRSLNKLMEYYIQTEEYEKCSKIKEILEYD